MEKSERKEALQEIFKLKKKGIEFNVLKKALSEDKYRITRYRAKRLLFTLHRPTNAHLAIIKEKINGKQCNSGIIAYEMGKHGDSNHLQGYITLNERVFVRKWLDIKTAHIETANQSDNANIRYIFGINKSHELQNILLIKNIEVPTDYRTPDVIHPNNFRPWQRSLWNLVNREPNPRLIYWVYETEGNTGKSAFCRTMSFCRGSCILGGNESAMKHGTSKFVTTNGSYPYCVLVDLARSNKSNFSFTAIEDIKNKFFFSYRLDSTEVKGKFDCHILIFANHAPTDKDLCQLSKDRWIVLQIKDQKLKLIMADKKNLKTVDTTELTKDELYNRALIHGFDFYIENKFIHIKSLQKKIVKEIKNNFI